MQIFSSRVVPEWVDYNGHMNDAEYARVFSLAVDELMVHIGLDAAGRLRHGYTLYTLETHLSYRKEAHEGQPLSVNVLLLNRDAKRLHVYFEMHSHEGNLLAASEQMLMGMDSLSSRPAPFPGSVEEALGRLPRCAPDAWPSLAGRKIGLG
ncbi:MULTISPECIES: thioesterase family protein [unclassified Halomonas]|uniref:thioesterase family protein n=1 Tax=unclassified Halomonas TaxID=2609666 RepID=UPI002076970F|nr:MULTISPECIES: thioesterase family protein [unclassified Halomonas]